MALDNAQLATLRTALLNSQDPQIQAWVAARADNDIAQYYQQASTFVVWRRSVATAEVGLTVNYVAVEAMTDANRNRIQTFYVMNPDSFDPSRSDIRDYWANTFSGALGGQGAATRTALDALWRRLANRGEALFATGTGTDQSPGTLTFEGEIDATDVGRALSGS